MLEKEFAGNVVTAGYIGYRADRLILGVTKNYNIAPAGPGNVNARRPYAAQYPAMANVNILENVGKATYDAAQFVFTRRYRAGLSMSSHYTLAHSRQGTLEPWNFQKLEWGDTQQFDVRHRFVVTANYELPWGKDLTGVAHGFLAAWQVNRHRLPAVGRGLYRGQLDLSDQYRQQRRYAERWRSAQRERRPESSIE